MLDCRQECQYEYVNKLTPQMLVWELLRRSSKYRKSWDRVQQLLDMNNQINNYGLLKYYGKPWLLQQIVDPDLDSPVLEWTVYPHPVILTRSNKSHDYLDLENVSKMAVGIDFTKPLTPQIDALEKDLMERQKELEVQGSIKVRRVSNNYPNWIEYLRVLDARENKLDYEDIGNFLYPDLAADPDKDHCEKAERTAKLARKWCKPEMYLKILLTH